MGAILTINGVPAQADDLRLLVANNYGHFTALRVEDGKARGLSLHLDRLHGATRELFGSELDRERVRAWLRQAIGDERRELSVRINVFSRRFDRAHPGAAVAPDVLISVAPAPAPMHRAPLRLKSFVYGRELPQVKHVGTFPLFHFRALAQRAGFDDALFVDAAGTIAEASIWNIGLFDGARIVWPQAPQLDGIGMQLLKLGLKRHNIASVSRMVRLPQLDEFHAAFLTNSSMSYCPIAAIDGFRFTDVPSLAELLRRCHESNPLQPI